MRLADPPLLRGGWARLLKTGARRVTFSAARVLSGLDRAQAVADLYRLYERREEKGDQSALLLTLEKASKSTKARADVRALAAEMLGELAIAQGQLPRAVSLFDGVAPIRTWSIIGPFENEGRSGLTTAYPPEKDGFDPKAVYRGKEHDVAWRTLPQGHSPYAFVDLAAAVYPRSDVAVYAATLLRSAQAQGVLFHLGASGASYCASYPDTNDRGRFASGHRRLPYGCAPCLRARRQLGRKSAVRRLE